MSFNCFGCACVPLLQAAPPGGAASCAPLALQPLLQPVAFGTLPGARAWPAHLAQLVQRAADASGDDARGGGGSRQLGAGATRPAAAATAGEQHEGAAAPPAAGPHGDLCFQAECQRLLLSAWAEAGAAAPAAANESDQADAGGGGGGGADVVRWLGSLSLLLRRRRAAAAARKAASEQLPFALKVTDAASDAAGSSLAEAHPAVTALLAALLTHPSPDVRVAAAAAARELLLLLPLAALPLLPLVMYQLQRGAAAGSGTTGSSSGGARAQAALLQLLPVMAADAALAPYALRVLQPMLQPEAPEPLRCLALKLTCDVWLCSGEQAEPCKPRTARMCLQKTCGTEHRERFGAPPPMSHPAIAKSATPTPFPPPHPTPDSPVPLPPPGVCGPRRPRLATRGGRTQRPDAPGGPRPSAGAAADARRARARRLRPRPRKASLPARPLPCCCRRRCALLRQRVLCCTLLVPRRAVLCSVQYSDVCMRTPAPPNTGVLPLCMVVCRVVSRSPPPQPPGAWSW